MTVLYLPRRLLNFHNHTYTQKSHTEKLQSSQYVYANTACHCGPPSTLPEKWKIAKNWPWAPAGSYVQWYRHCKALTNHKCSFSSCAIIQATVDWGDFTKDPPPHKVLGFGYLPKWLVSTFSLRQIFIKRWGTISKYFLIKHQALGEIYGIWNSTTMKRKCNFLLHSVKDNISPGL